MLLELSDDDLWRGDVRVQYKYLVARPQGDGSMPLGWRWEESVDNRVVELPAIPGTVWLIADAVFDAPAHPQLCPLSRRDVRVRRALADASGSMLVTSRFAPTPEPWAKLGDPDDSGYEQQASIKDDLGTSRAKAMFDASALIKPLDLAGCDFGRAGNESTEDDGDDIFDSGSSTARSDAASVQSALSKDDGGGVSDGGVSDGGVSDGGSSAPSGAALVQTSPLKSDCDGMCDILSSSARPDVAPVQTSFPEAFQDDQGPPFECPTPPLAAARSVEALYATAAKDAAARAAAASASSARPAKGWAEALHAAHAAQAFGHSACFGAIAMLVCGPFAR